ncbi:NADH-quinone oxidoreductase subunit A [Magnetofaba australis]|uniref:NADH-quinone oxidoreductase subunit A n=1 Tax=Magnetofaba australis IT-1 TaxID=1434232 RepID=A0A1Y2K7C0_9PROT|nr:NADH-quinone oxidoreductase subunit A [Magnetofaba australis]OSM06216.1 putative NADH-ubiquinone/plastoquinone oxidoreductase, chain 3 [Magnetofaba australis IT-1]
MLEGYFPVLMLVFVALGISVFMMAASYILGVKRPYYEKRDQYECGFAPLARVYIQFDVRYYLLAILFIIFDIEAAFLFPWAVAFTDIGLIGFVEMILFLAVLLVGYAYAWKKGALEWE